MATPEYKGGRVVVPASSAYNNADGMGIKKSNIPFDNGLDVSYPENIPNTIDYFYDIPQNEMKFIANVDKDGYGLLQFSSSRLQGRKLFSWGHKKGAAHWQSMLTDKAGDYVEIQAGLGKTQYECIPMPPKCVWSFTECYTLADIPAAKLNAPYAELVGAVRAQISALGGERLEERLSDIAENISTQKGELIFSGSGFGYLHTVLGGTAPRHLTFCMADDVRAWVQLAQGEQSNTRLSFAYGKGMKEILLKNINTCNWDIPYQLALLAYDQREFDTAKRYCADSLILDSNAYNNHLYAFILFQLDDEKCVYFAEKSIEQNTGSYCLAESILSLLLQQEAYLSVIRVFQKLSSDLQNYDRLLMYLSMAYLKSGNARQAENILLADGGLQLSDFREGDKFLDTLYRSIRKELYDEKDKDIVVPEQFDFIVADIQAEDAL